MPQQQQPPQVDLAGAAAALQQAAAGLPGAVRDAVTAGTAAPTPPADEWAPMNAQGQPINYNNVTVPQPLVDALASENPVERAGAVNTLVRHMMHTTHQMAVQHAVSMLRNELTQVLPNYVRSQLEGYDSRREVFNDFYGAFPQLSHPSLRPLVMQEAQKLAAQTGARGWSQQFRNQLGEHVINLLRSLAAVPGAQPTGPSMAAPTARPAGMRGNGQIDANDPMSIFG